MSRISIKSRVALWYAFSLLAVLILVAALLLAAGDRLILDETKSNLTAVTDRAVGDVWIINGSLTLDDDITYYSDGASVILYREDRTLISGLVPSGFPEDTPFVAEEIRRIRSGKNQFYVYDRLIENQKAGKIWVRGISSARLEDMAPAVMKMVTGFLVALPILFLAALAGGWMLTRQAFGPLNQIVDTAEQIRTSGELSRRIGLGDTQDVDEIRRTAAIFDDMLDQIEENFEAEKRFTNDASHELRTPIAVILAQSEYALENLGDPEEVQESLQEIRSQAKNMSSLVSQLLALARADRGIEQLKKEPTDLSILAEESAERLKQAAARYGISLQVDAEEGCYMQGDSVFLGRMFDNLIDNSLKYGKQGGHTEILVKQKAEGKIHVMIRDDGIGIAEEEISKIWQRFYRVDRQKESGKSMGLGLSLVKWIVQEHQGAIHCESQLGEGTTFHIEFSGGGR